MNHHPPHHTRAASSWLTSAGLLLAAATVWTWGPHLIFQDTHQMILPITTASLSLPCLATGLAGRLLTNTPTTEHRP